MKTVRMKKLELVEIVTKNRKEHRDIFLKAQKAYREKMIEVLDRQLKNAREQQPFSIHEIVQMVQPSDHTEDYDRALKMLELEVERIITLDEQAFDNLVLDDWGWGRQWAASNSGYVTSAKFNKYL